MSGGFCTKVCPVPEGFGEGYGGLCQRLGQRCCEQAQNVTWISIWCLFHMTVPSLAFVTLSLRKRSTQKLWVQVDAGTDRQSNIDATVRNEM